MAKTTTARARLEGRGSVQSVFDLDNLTVCEIVEAYYTDREDPFVNPWKRGYNVAIRRAFGH